MLLRSEGSSSCLRRWKLLVCTHTFSMHFANSRYLWKSCNKDRVILYVFYKRTCQAKEKSMDELDQEADVWVPWLWLFGEWRWDRWAASRSPRAQSCHLQSGYCPPSLAVLLTACSMVPLQHTTPETIYVQKWDSMTASPSPPDSVVQCSELGHSTDTTGRLQGELWQLQKHAGGRLGLWHVQNRHSLDKRKDLVFG